ncbi:unnamed protein product [Adineta steineri]|uniref:F-box domain-containing protein n=1 Tax=Adineta steineri TaxID=433720 RepID=A0A815CCN6_9BILA|nr:unnamed protein product [Adineta steineri]CAF3812533.1 unnamed protein product [Adineta steineri]
MRTTIDRLYPDIWLQVFEYFNAQELCFSLIHITKQADDVLFNINHRFCLRGLVLDTHVQILPEQLLLRQVISLEVHQNNHLDNIQQCLELRSLKLIGHPEWIISILGKISHANSKHEQLTLVIPGIGLLHNLFASISSLLSLRRLEIYGDQLEERIKSGTSFLAQTKIEQFILHSCSPMSWNDLSSMLPGLFNIRFLDITLIHLSKNSLCSFVFPKLRSVSLILLEVPFDCIIQLATTMPSLVKLKINGLVDAEGFVVNNKWLNLLESCSSLIKVTVSLSLEQGTNCYYNELIQTALHGLNLNLRYIDDDYEYDLDRDNQFRWWNLSGVMIKKGGHMFEKYQTPS